MKRILALAGAGGALVLLTAALHALTDAGPALATHADGAGHVFVNNAPSEAIPVSTMDGRLAWTRRLMLHFGLGDSAANATLSVPAGRRMVIEYVSIVIDLSVDLSRVELVTQSFPENGKYVFPVTRYQDRFFVAQPMRAYANAGTSTLTVRRGSTAYTGSVDATIVGYLIPTT